jgi:hypothetical protein
MGKLRKDFKYKIIKNFLSKEEIELFKRYVLIKHKTNTTSFDFHQNNNGDTCFYGDAAVESLMLTKRKLVEQESGFELFPTYSYWRMYSYLSDLKKHQDRPSCEISVTVMVGSCGTPWPIYMDGTPIEIEIGDAALYLGCEVEHWREEFQGDWHAQMFLHYVDKKGPHANLVCDGRPMFGLTKG